jgi:hypothetical protein
MMTGGGWGHARSRSIGSGSTTSSSNISKSTTHVRSQSACSIEALIWDYADLRVSGAALTST